MVPAARMMTPKMAPAARINFRTRRTTRRRRRRRRQRRRLSRQRNASGTRRQRTSPSSRTATGLSTLRPAKLRSGGLTHAKTRPRRSDGAIDPPWDGESPRNGGPCSRYDCNKWRCIFIFISTYVYLQAAYEESKTVVNMERKHFSHSSPEEVDAVLDLVRSSATGFLICSLTNVPAWFHDSFSFVDYFRRLIISKATGRSGSLSSALQSLSRQRNEPRRPSRVAGIWRTSLTRTTTRARHPLRLWRSRF